MTGRRNKFTVGLMAVVMLLSMVAMGAGSVAALSADDRDLGQGEAVAVADPAESEFEDSEVTHTFLVQTDGSATGDLDDITIQYSDEDDIIDLSNLDDSEEDLASNDDINIYHNDGGTWVDLNVDLDGASGSVDVTDADDLIEIEGIEDEAGAGANLAAGDEILIEIGGDSVLENPDGDITMHNVELEDFSNDVESFTPDLNMDEGPIELDDGETTFYNSLHKAVAAADDGGETVTVTEDLDLSLPTDDTATISTGDEGDVTIQGEDDEVEIVVDESTAVGGVSDQLIDIEADEDGVVIQDLKLTVEDGDLTAIETGAVADLEINNVIVEDFEDDQSLVIEVDGNFDLLDSTVILDSDDHGLQLDASASEGDIVISGNTFEHTSASGSNAILIDELPDEAGELDISDTVIESDDSADGVVLQTGSAPVGDTTLDNVTAEDINVGLDLTDTDLDGDIHANDLNITGSDDIAIDSDGNGGDADITITNSIIQDVDNQAFRITDGANYDADVTVESTTINDTATGVAAIDVDGDHAIGDFELRDVTIGHSDQAAAFDVIGDQLIVDGLTLNEIGNTGPYAFDSEDNDNADVSVVDVSGVVATDIDNAVLNLQSGTNDGSSFSVNDVSVENVTSNPAALIDIGGVAGFEQETTVTDVSVVNVTDDQDQPIMVLGGEIDTDRINTLDVSEIHVEDVNEDVEDEGIQINTGANEVNVDDVVVENASGLEALDIQEVDTDRDDVSVDITNLAINDTAIGVNLEDGNNADEVTISGEVTNSNDRAVHLQEIASDAELTVTDLKVAETDSADGVDLASVNPEQVEIDQSEFEDVDGNAIHVNADLDLNVTNSDFEEIENWGIATSTAPGDLVATHNNFEVDDAIDDSGGNFDSANATWNYWNHSTGPFDVSGADEFFGQGAEIDLSDTSELHPWVTEADGENAAFGFQGDIEDADEDPVGDEVEVTFDYFGQTSDIDGEFDSETTTAQGEYVAIIEEHDGSEFYTAVAQIDGFADSDEVEDITISSDVYIADGIEFQMNEGGNIEGTIFNATDETEEIDDVEIIDADTDDVIDTVEVSEDGTYSSDDFTPGTYDLKADHPDFDASEVVEDVEVESGNTTEDVNFTLQEDTTATLEATIEDADGDAVEDTDVTFSAPDVDFEETVETDDDGEATVEVPEGEYQITADAEGFGADTRTLDIRQSETLSLTFTLEGVDDDPLAEYRNAEDEVDIQGLRDAIDDFTANEIGIDVLRQVINAFTS